MPNSTLTGLWKYVSWCGDANFRIYLYTILFYWVAVTKVWHAFVLRRVETALRHGKWLGIYWIRSYGHPTKGDPPAWSLREGLITSHRKMSTYLKWYRDPRIRRILWDELYGGKLRMSITPHSFWVFPSFYIVHVK